MIRLKIKDVLIHTILTEAGYDIHPKGYFEGGYIRELQDGFRFHAKIKDTKKIGDIKTVEIHLDRTIGYHHNVQTFRDPEKIEAKYLNNIIRKYYRSPVPKVKKEIVVPNVQEVQKVNHGKIKSNNILINIWKSLSIPFR